MRQATRVALLLVVTTGCFATRSDVQLVQQDLVVMRAESARSDSVLRAQLQQVVNTLGMSSDSMRVLSARMARLSGDLSGTLYELGQQLVQIQELTGQSQRRLQEVRASLEQRSASIGAPVAGADPATGQPGPNQLFQLALDQLRRGSTGAARSAFQDLLTRYPQSDVAGEAQFYIGESWRLEGNRIAADSAYLTVVDKYPKSPRAPTALYKYSQSLEAAGDVPRAKSFLELIVKEYPRSDEAVLASDRLRALK
jgi:tol-pal system protein YbgF